MGYERIANYDRSFGEWGNRDDTPIARPGDAAPQAGGLEE